MKVLFLDIDGVLNSKYFYLRRSSSFRNKERSNEIDPLAMDRLNKIVTISGCKVVISSTWKIDERLSLILSIKEIFASFGFIGNIIGNTPDVNNYKYMARRGTEIQEWLNNNKQVTNICILDDDSDMAHLIPWLVKTSFDTGLLDEHVELCLNTLNKSFR